MIFLVENGDGLIEFDRAMLAEAGIRVVELTHQGKNRIGDGNGVPFPEGLTEQGKGLLKELSRPGFAFDAAHLAEPGFRDLVRMHEGPPLSSHTGVRACRHSEKPHQVRGRRNYRTQRDRGNSRRPENADPFRARLQSRKRASGESWEKTGAPSTKCCWNRLTEGKGR